MKLRTKLTLSSILLVVVAIAVCCGLILSFVQADKLKAVSALGKEDFQIFLSTFRQAISTKLPAQEIVKRSYLVNAFRSVEGFEEFSLQQGNDYICNNSGFDIENLFANEVKPVSGDESIHIKIARVVNKDYIVANTIFTIETEKYDLSFARDISNITGEIRALAVQCVVVALCVIVCAAVAMWMIVYRAMKPVDQLRVSAKELAMGNYTSRIRIRGKDELSELAVDFNSMADAIEANVDALNEKSARQQMFINDISHELKTPVTSILLSAETLLGRKVSVETLQRSLSRIYEQGKWLEQLSQKLMSLVLLQAEPALRPESVIELLKAVNETTEGMLKQRGITLVIDCNQDRLNIDFDLMHAALVNLVNNAEKASSENQRIEIRAYDAVIEVIDFGKGIPKEEIARITEPFYRVDHSRNKKSGGAGLGLALVKRIAEVHHAEILIKSDIGCGTTVRLEFPKLEK